LNNRATQGPRVQGREPILKVGTLRNHTKITNTSTPRIPVNRVAMLEQIAERWAERGYYRSPSRAMYALLWGIYE
jgi:hypothetical protein